MSFEMRCVDHLELIRRIGLGLCRGLLEQSGKHAALGPSQVEAIDAVPFSIFLRKLVPW